MNPERHGSDERLVSAFDDCLARIEVGATTRSTLARRPDLESDLAPMIRQAIEVQSLFARIAAPPEIAARIERRLSDESAGPREWWRRILETLIGRRGDGTFAPRSAPALAVIALLAVLVGGIALARASRSGDLLHPLKLGTDRVFDAIRHDDAGGTDEMSKPDRSPTDAIGVLGPSTSASETSSSDARATEPESGSTATRVRAITSSALRSATPRPTTTLTPKSNLSDSPTLNPIATMTPSATPTEIAPTSGRDRPTRTPLPSATASAHPTVAPSATPSIVPATPAPTATFTPELPPPSGRIVGNVQYKESEDPVSGIEVVARRIESDPDAPPITLGETRAAETDGEGRFEFDGLPVGFWVVGAGDPRVWWEVSESAEYANPIEVAAGATRDGIRIRIERPIADQYFAKLNLSDSAADPSAPVVITVGIVPSPANVALTDFVSACPRRDRRALYTSWVERLDL